MRMFCITFYKENATTEYDNQEPLHSYITEIKVPTKYISANTTVDDIDITKTSGYANCDNGAYFTEGYNIIQAMFSTLDDKLLMLSEDHYFTTGETLKELIDADYDVAYGDAESKLAGYLKGNGSILCINPSKVKHLFPIVEYLRTTVEWIIGTQLLMKINPSRLHSISTRKWIDYCGDGSYTNSSVVMEQHMKDVGIL